MQKPTIALFGEAEKGAFHSIYYLKTLEQLNTHLGEPPQDSKGLPMAIQLIHFNRDLLYIRVKEEGFSLKDYYVGLKLLEDDTSILSLMAIAMPGLGDSLVLQESFQVCDKKGCLLITTEEDLYDFLTCTKQDLLEDR